VGGNPLYWIDPNGQAEVYMGGGGPHSETIYPPDGIIEHDGVKDPYTGLVFTGKMVGALFGAPLVVWVGEEACLAGAATTIDNWQTIMTIKRIYDLLQPLTEITGHPK